MKQSGEKKKKEHSITWVQAKKFEPESDQAAGPASNLEKNIQRTKNMLNCQEFASSQTQSVEDSSGQFSWIVPYCDKKFSFQVRLYWGPCCIKGREKDCDKLKGKGGGGQWKTKL